MAETQHSVRVVKQFPYQAEAAKHFSNRYYFDGGSPGDATAWHLLMDGFVALEVSNYESRVTIVQALGYAPGSDVAVAEKAYTTPGTLAKGGAGRCPGDCAVVLRMATTKKSTKNHTVYVFSYYHGALNDEAVTSPDNVHPPQRAQITAFGEVLHTGFSVAGRTYKRTTPDGHLTTGQLVDQFVGHRDFPG